MAMRNATQQVIRALEPSLTRSLHASPGSKKIVGVFYKGGEYAVQNPNFVGCVENALGIRSWLESQGHQYIVTDDKDGPSCAGEAHRGRARAHHHALPPGVRVRGPHQARQEPGAAPHGGDRLRPHRPPRGGGRGAHRRRGHRQQHRVGGGGPADAHPRPHAQLHPGAPPGHQRGVGPRRHRAPGLRPGGQDGGHRRRRTHREATAPAAQALRMQPALPRQAPHRRCAGGGARRHFRGGPRRHVAQVRRRRAQHAAHREDQGHVQQGEDRQDEERRHHRQQRSWCHHGHAGSGRRLQNWPHRWIRRRRVVPAAGAQGPPVEVNAQQRHDAPHLRHHHRRPAEVRGRCEGHAGEVLQGPGLPGAQLHRQGRQARQPVPVNIHGVAAARIVVPDTRK